MSIGLNNEVWKDVVGYEGLYQISNMGNLKALSRTFKDVTGRIRVFPEKIKKTCETSKREGKQGYLCSRLKDYFGKTKTLFIHRLVGEAFIENPENKQTINHKDGNKHNNYVENLEWCSYSENNQHALDYGLRDKYIGCVKKYKPIGN